MASVGIRLNKKLEKAIADVRNEESVNKSTAVRLLLDTGYKQWRFRKVLERLRRNEVTVWEAARYTGYDTLGF